MPAAAGRRLYRWTRPEGGPGESNDLSIQRRLELLDQRDQLLEKPAWVYRLPPARWVVGELTAVAAAGVVGWGMTRGGWGEAAFVALLMVLIVGGYYTILAVASDQAKRRLQEIEEELEQLP